MDSSRGFFVYRVIIYVNSVHSMLLIDFGRGLKSFTLGTGGRFLELHSTTQTLTTHTHPTRTQTLPL
jgi:type IV secretory pathway VirB4 component